MIMKIKLFTLLLISGLLTNVSTAHADRFEPRLKKCDDKIWGPCNFYGRKCWKKLNGSTSCKQSGVE